MKNVLYSFVLIVIAGTTSCQMADAPDLTFQNTNCFRSAGAGSSTATEGIIIVNLQSVGLVKIKCNQCHGTTGGLVQLAEGKLASQNFNEVHKGMIAAMEKYGYQLPLNEQNILSLKNFLETKQTALSK